MKKFLSFMAAFALCLSLQAQTTSPEDYLRRYNNLVQRVGAAGVGVETLLDKWAADYPDDLEMLLARFSFCFTRSESTQVIQLDRDRYLGNAPILPFTDSLGVKRNYFEDPQYDDDLFSQAEQALNRAIELHPERLDLAFLRVTALTAYEKESPDMALSVLKSIVDRHYNEELGWKFQFTMKQNEYFVLPDAEHGFLPTEVDLMDEASYGAIVPHLFRVQKLSTRDYFFRHQYETSVTAGDALPQGVAYVRIRNENGLKGFVKVRINHVGQIVHVGEY